MGCQLFSCFLPCSTTKQYQDHNSFDDDQSSSHTTNSIINSSDSSTNSSFSSQRSLPSIPSLTPSSQNTLQYRCVATLKGHNSHVFSLALAEKVLYSGGSNGEIRMCYRSFDRVSNYNCMVVEGYSAVKSMVVLGDKLITAHHDHKIRVWKIDTSDKILTHNSSRPTDQKHHYKLITTLPTLNDRCIRLFSAKNYVRLRRHKTCTWVHHVDTVSSLTLSPDNHLLYSVSWDRTLKVWRTSDFKCIESLQNAHDDAINSVVLSKTGIVFTGSADKMVKVWKKNIVKGNKIKHSLICTLEKHKSAVNALALSSDDKFLYSGACDRSIIVWEGLIEEGGCNNNYSNWAVIGALRGHRKAILCLTVVDDLLFSGSSDKTVRAWRRDHIGGYCCLAVFEGHNGPIKCLSAASLDYRDDEEKGNCYVVYSGSLDFDVKVWQFWV